VKKQIILYGLLLAMLAVILQALDYSNRLKMLSTEWYVILIAVLFTLSGIWLGSLLNSRKKTPSDFELNRKALDYLQISERELEVLTLLAQGLSNDEIAGRLFVSVNTVKTHLSNLYQKLDVKRRTQAVSKGKSLKLIP
jgi:DNA-binding CsgD family transcriptional regulator